MYIAYIAYLSLLSLKEEDKEVGETGQQKDERGIYRVRLKVKPPFPRTDIDTGGGSINIDTPFRSRRMQVLRAQALPGAYRERKSV